jgi:hypothetical protein
VPLSAWPVLYQEKTPAAERQTRERVGMNEGSADTLSYDEKDYGTHPTTLPHLRLVVNFILGSGRTIGCPTNDLRGSVRRMVKKCVGWQPGLPCWS